MSMIPNRRESLSNKFKLKELENHFNNYKPRKSVSGCNNVMFKHGNGEKYTRLSINKIKVRLSHIVWRINTRGKIPKGYNIHHIDENKRNNDFTNLELVEAGKHGCGNLKNNIQKGVNNE